MKKILFLLPVLFIAFISCNNKKEDGGTGETANSKSIVGKWKVVDMNMEDMSEEEKDDAIQNATIDIRKDGSFTHKDSEGTENGTYKFDEETNTLVVTSDEDEKEVEFKISWRGKNMVMKGEGGSVVLARSSGSSPNNRDDEDMDNSRVTSIVGKWRIADVESPDGEKPTADELRDLRASTIEFDRDGSYVAITRRDGEPDRETGSYKFDARAKTLETVSEKDETQSFDVEFRGKNRMICTSGDGKITLEKD